MSKLRSFLGLFKFSRSVFFLEVILGFFIASGFFFSRWDFFLLFMVFISFSLLVYPGLYTINDILDLDSDKKHPEKRKRPIASGAISIRLAVVFSIFAISVGLVMGYLISMTLFFMELLFVLVNVVYSFRMKHVRFFELVFNGLTHPLRFYLGVVLAGGSGFIIITSSMLLVSMMFSTLKRENEIVKKHTAFRETLKRYVISELYLVYALVFVLLWLCFFYVTDSSKIFVLVEILIFIFAVGGYHFNGFSRRLLQKFMDPFL